MAAQEKLRSLAAEVIEELCERGAPFSFRSAGSSMLLTILPGSTLEVTPTRDVEVGDIALVRGPRGVVAHRVIATTDGDVELQGDGQARPHVVPWDDVLGRITRVTWHGLPLPATSAWAPGFSRAMRRIAPTVRRLTTLAIAARRMLRGS